MTTPVRGRGRPRRIEKTTSVAPAEELLLAAAELFSERGFAGTTTRDIAARAGLQHASLFHYYPTKEDLLLALSEQALQVPLANLKHLEDLDGRAGAKLWALVDLQVAHLCSQPYAMTSLLQDALRLPRDRFAAWYSGLDRYTHGVEELVSAGIRDGHFSEQAPVVATMAILGMVIWTIRWYRPDGPVTGEELAGSYASFALKALTKDRRTYDSLEAEGRRLAAAVAVSVAAEK